MATLIAVWRSPTTRAEPVPSRSVQASPTWNVHRLMLTSVLATRNRRYGPIPSRAPSEIDELIARAGSRSGDARAIVGREAIGRAAGDRGGWHASHRRDDRPPEP